MGCPTRSGWPPTATPCTCPTGRPGWFGQSAKGSSRQIATDLLAPEGLAVDGGRLLVVEEGRDRVSAIDLATGAVTPVIEGLSLGSRVIPTAPPHGVFNGVTVGPNASIYVTDDGANAVYEFKR